MSQTNDGTTQSRYIKGHLRMVDKGNGRMVLEPVAFDDAAALSHNIDHLAASLDTSGLSLQDSDMQHSNNPYDSNNTAGYTAKLWASGGAR